MKRRRFGGISADVVAYCEAVEVPDFDEAAITSRSHVPVHRIARSRTRMRMRMRMRTVASVAALIALFVGLCEMPAVVAGVERVFAAFTVAAGRTAPMTIRIVGLERAKADMPFAVIAPPPIAGAPEVTVGEMYAGASLAEASVVFELHGTAPGPEIMIIETKAARNHARTLFAMRGAADRPVLPVWRSLQSPAPSGHSLQKFVLRGSVAGHAFAPASWVAHGTRVAVMSPPGLLSIAQLQTIRRAMSR